MSFNAVVSVGYGDPEDDLEIDAALEFSTASYSATWLEGDDELTDEGSGLGIGLSGRAFVEMSEAIDLGILAGFQTRSRSTELDDPDDNRSDEEENELMVGVGVGPRYTITDEATIAAYATLGIRQATSDPEGRNNLDDEVDILLPGVTVSAEWWLFHWFAYRSGIVSQYLLISTENQEDTDQGGVEGTDRNLLFYWSNGVGFAALRPRLPFRWHDQLAGYHRPSRHVFFHSQPGLPDGQRVLHVLTG
jgi:hypothetical protein